MKVEGSFFRIRTLVKMTRAALKIWQSVANYTTKPLLCQGVEGDVAMVKNTRRVFAAPAKKEKGKHIAFDDKCKLITPDKAVLDAPPEPQVQVVALANWEAAPTFVLDEHLGTGFPKASTDRLLNKCNPFLSGKRRAQSADDLASEAPTVSTDFSTISEDDVEDQELDVVKEEVDAIEEKEPITLDDQTNDAKVELVSTQCESSNKTAQYVGAIEAKSKKQAPRWVCVGHGYFIKRGADQMPKVDLSQKTETSSTTVRWVQIRHGRYTKYYINGETWEKAIATNNA